MSHTSNAQPLNDADILHELADLCLDSCVSPAGPVAVGFAIEDDDIVVSLREVAHVGDLVGFDAPDTWSVFGLVATSAQRPIVHLQHRDGQELTIVDGAELPPGEGRVPDVCRRVLGLATRPILYSSARFFAQVWLERCVLHALDHDNPSWDDLRDRFVFAPLCHQAAQPTGRSADQVFRALGRPLAERYPWAILRRTYCSATRDSAISPEAATWMDDAMFARELLAERLAVPVLLDDLESMVRRGVADAVREVLVEWGVDLSEIGL